jgi:hypothetical protein
MSPYIAEQLEILRRIAERGLRLAQDNTAHDARYIDLFQHMLDEIQRTKSARQ